MKWEENLIRLYFYLCEDSGVQRHLSELRMSNNQRVEFTDEEIMTVYLFGITQNYSKVKQVYKYTKQHLFDWFPSLPSYQAFNNRLNKLHVCFELLIQSISRDGLLQGFSRHEKIIDSVPIIVAGNSRSSSAKVAPQLCNKGYCSSKQMYYYGIKLHVTAAVRPRSLPMPKQSWITAAGENDLTAARQVFQRMDNCKIYADKIYIDTELNNQMQRHQNSIILTPIKKQKGQKIKDAAADLYSYLVSAVRQPIESLFNWIIEKTNIQSAQRVRSESGLRVHVWGKFAAALMLLSKFLTLD